jgi:hypothetical protein
MRTFIIAVRYKYNTCNSYNPLITHVHNVAPFKIVHALEIAIPPDFNYPSTKCFAGRLRGKKSAKLQRDKVFQMLYIDATDVPKQLAGCDIRCASIVTMSQSASQLFREWGAFNCENLRRNVIKLHWNNRYGNYRRRC